MSHQSLFHKAIWVFLTVVLLQALAWLVWLYRFYLQPPRYAVTLVIGLLSILVSTGAIVTSLVLGLLEASAGRTPAFWFEIGYTIYAFLNGTAMVLVTIVWREQLFKPLPDHNDMLRNDGHPQWWTFTAITGLVLVAAAIGVAAASLSPIGLVIAVFGAMIVQLACSMWTSARSGTVIRLGLGVSSALMLVAIIVLLAVVMYKDSKTPLRSIIPLFLCSMQQVAILGHALVVYFESPAQLRKTVVSISRSAQRLCFHDKSSPDTQNATLRRTESSRSVGNPLANGTTMSSSSQHTIEQPSSLYMQADNGIALSSHRAQKSVPVRGDQLQSPLPRSFDSSTLCDSALANINSASIAMKADPFSSYLHAGSPGMPVGIAGKPTTLVKQPEHEVSQFFLNDHTYITVVSDHYAVDQLEDFAAGQPWHQTPRGVYLLADFIKHLRDVCQHPLSSSPLISIAQDLRLHLHTTLKAEVERYGVRTLSASDPWYRYDVWSILVSLQYSSVIVLADHTGRITPDGSEVEAHIDNFYAAHYDVVISFKAEMQSLEQLQIPWHCFFAIDSYGVIL